MKPKAAITNPFMRFPFTTRGDQFLAETSLVELEFHGQMLSRKRSKTNTARQLWKQPVGILEVGILGAQGLLPMKMKDDRGTADAYCVAKYVQKWVRTRKIIDTFNPKWNEQYTWEVYDPCTVIPTNGNSDLRFHSPCYRYEKASGVDWLSLFNLQFDFEREAIKTQEKVHLARYN
ncbi:PHOSPHORIBOSYLANTHRANILATE TRANSFERASE ISOFORM 1 [Salix purpurea]|uniref:PHOSPHORIBOSYLANTHRANILATE TRANSFERASE ISOFORM 1 n=1 Tax=Salix purpurea TaxID=77065 RepID=A0A9Q1A209_SALPP|nr:PHOSPHORIBOSYLANTHRANILATE TRANSFERASE ISOFORM 1 [Salix purpurea]